MLSYSCLTVVSGLKSDFCAVVPQTTPSLYSVACKLTSTVILNKFYLKCWKKQKEIMQAVWIQG